MVNVIGIACPSTGTRVGGTLLQASPGDLKLKLDAHTQLYDFGHDATMDIFLSLWIFHFLFFTINTKCANVKERKRGQHSSAAVALPETRFRS